MTNITLSIDDDIYKKMRKYSEVKWSELVRKMIEKRINEMEKIDENENEGVFTMLASQEVLIKDWDNELDERWNNV